ncbi:MAG TPA: xanthine dehydrogenase accessory protein XdhC [Dongiaceae bacterium]|nr:xanthine dehydrogenase accessory protein XdhC [Dongiaceae bacterium]
MRVWATLAKALDAHRRCAMVTVAKVEGSAPREAGARLIVVPGGGFFGTIGGGTLEWRALAEAQAALERGAADVRLTRHALGPEFGQCCGGRVSLLLEVIDAAARPSVEAFAAREAAGPFVSKGRIAGGRIVRELVDTAVAGADPAVTLSAAGVLIEWFGEKRRDVLLFGAGHVGRALVLAFGPLPVNVTWIDARADAFPGAMPSNARPVHSEAPAAELDRAPAGAFVLVMTHSHALDLHIVHAALAAGRFPYVGLIGSATKRARFAKRLRDAGVAEDRIARLVCPIGIPGISAKAPAVIAAATVAEVLARDEALRTAQAPDASLGRTA